jgi:2-desacetyl-2-hydroxyethyl bacteriochlorophyllide A dehydrogenase
MRAVVLRGGRLVVDDVGEPQPGPGQALIETIACGICGSDLHCARHARSFTESAAATGMTIFAFDPDRDLVMGHEFSGRVLEIRADGGSGVPAPGGRRLVPGDLVVAHPMVRSADGLHSVGYSNDHPGGYAERFVVQASGLLPIPDGVDATVAALTEPLAVGLHAVNSSSAVEAGHAVVVGCGPVGLAVIAALAGRGVPLIVAADLSPTRRDLAARLGADVVVDPRSEPAIDAWRSTGGRGPAVVFEAVGVPGMLRATMRALPSRSELVVVGLCMEPDVIEPTVAISRQLTVRFVLGWTAEEFADSLAGIGSGRFDAAALVTGRVSLDGTPEAFTALAAPDAHVKVLVQPATA